MQHKTPITTLLRTKGSFLWHLKKVAQQLIGNIVQIDHTINDNGPMGRNRSPIGIPNGLISYLWTKNTTPVNAKYSKVASKFS